MKYLSVKEIAKKWNVSVRLVQQYCKDYRIEGQQKIGNVWAIPEDAKKPDDPRRQKRGESISSLKSTLKTIHLPIEDNNYSNNTDLRIGAVITAAGKFEDGKGISPFLNLGTTSLIRRIVLSFHQANIYDIVVITGYKDLELKYHLSNYGIIFIKNENYEKSDKLESAKLGLEFLRDKCDKVFFAGLQIPMFTANTLRIMCEKDYLITIPTFKNKRGHPVLIDTKAIPYILNYQGSDGMRGAMHSIDKGEVYIEVDDEGVLLSAENISRIDEILEEHNASLLHPFVRLSIEREQSFFDARAKLLLYLIEEFHSVSAACKQMALSQGKAWDMIKQIEGFLGFTVVERKRGGKKDRQTRLTKEGSKFLFFYTEYENKIKQYAKEILKNNDYWLQLIKSDKQ